MRSNFINYTKPTLKPNQRFEFLEWLANENKDNYKSWTQELKKALRIDEKVDVPWLNDVKILKFFQKEPKLSTLGDRGLY